MKIDKYPGISNTDSILFFIRHFNEYGTIKYTQLLMPVYPVGDPSTLDEYRFIFTYDQLVPNENCGIFYMAIPEQGDASYSSSAGIEYVSTDDDQTDSIYNKVTVYSSYAQIGSIKPGSTDDIVNEADFVSLSMINQDIPAGGDHTG
ncbi:hypothetical protein [Xenorhabdus stockiae]|uniref:hypothetical protein n=1 Tax=Xenorhabdus stockiae TaxID=351614 RepID=UPI0040637ECC